MPKQIIDIPLSEILIIKEDNPRIKYDLLPDLKKSMAANGWDASFPAQVVKLSATDQKANPGKKYRVIGGFTRVTAALAEDIATAPSVVCDYDKFRQLQNHILSNSGAPLTQLEQGRVYSEMRDYGTDPEKLEKGEELREKMTNADISRLVGKSSEHVRNCITVFESPAEVRDLIESGSVSARAIIEASKNVKDNKVVRKILDAAIASAVGEQATDKHVKKVKDQFVEVKFAGKKGGKKSEERLTPDKTDKSRTEATTSTPAPDVSDTQPDAEKESRDEGGTSAPAASLIDAGSTKNDHIVSIITAWCEETSTIVSDDDITELAKRLSEVF